DVAEGECVPFVLTHGPSHLPPPITLDWRAALQETQSFWRAWSARCSYSGRRREAVQRSLLTLKALTYAETGGIVAAPPTSRPRPHYVSGGAAWRPTQLGLSLLLAARCDLDSNGTRFRRLSRGSAGVAGVAPAQRGRKPEPAPNHVRLVRGTAAHRMGGAVATPVPRVRARGHLQSPPPFNPPPRGRRTPWRPLSCTQGSSCSPLV